MGKAADVAPGGRRLGVAAAAMSDIAAPAPANPGPSYQPSFALGTFLPELPTVAADRNQAMTAEAAPRILAMGGQVDDKRLSLWLVAIGSFLILLAVCIASLMDFSGFLRARVSRHFKSGPRLP